MNTVFSSSREKLQAGPATLVVLGTGGTIAGRGDDPKEPLAYRSATFSVEALVRSLPQGAALPATVRIESEQVAQIDSKDMDVATWLRLADRATHHLSRAEVAGVVVTHGTDTLEETAYWLARTLATTKPVVLTAAMRPATSRAADGPQNLADALLVAATMAAGGVVCVLAGLVHAAVDIRKRHPQRLDAFSSGDAGPLARVEPALGEVERRVRWHRDVAPIECIDRASLPAIAASWPWVEIVTSAAAAEPRAVRALVAAGVDGLVVAATGNGTLHHAMEGALREAITGGVTVLRSTRCLDGGIVEPAGADDCVLPSAGPMTPVQARVELMLRLAAKAG